MECTTEAATTEDDEDMKEEGASVFTALTTDREVGRGRGGEGAESSEIRERDNLRSVRGKAGRREAEEEESEEGGLPREAERLGI